MPNKAETAAHRRLRAVIDRAELVVARSALRALRQLQDAIPLDRLERVIASHDAFALHDLIGTLPARLRPAVAAIDKVFESGLAAGNQMLSKTIGNTTIRFDSSNPIAAKAARDEGAHFVLQITNDTRSAIRTVVARSFTEGLPPREAAKLIRPLIGLTSRQARAVAGRRSDLIAEGMSSMRASALASAYAGKLLARRAEAIARTEIIRASTAGAIASWNGAKAAGLVGARAHKVWIVTDDDRLCPICRPLDGVLVPLDGKFKTASGFVDGPPVHPMCRCTIGLEPNGSPAEAAAQARASEQQQRVGKLGTQELYRNQDGTWDPSRQRMHDRFVRNALKNIPKSDAPTVYMMGGGPASGKGSIIRSGDVTVPSRTASVHVDPDGFKAMLPEYKRMKKAGDLDAAPFVHEESSYLSKRVVAEAARKGFDVVLDGVGDSGIDSVAAKVEQYRATGHRVVANYVTVDTETALARATAAASDPSSDRFGRAVPEGYLRTAHADVSRVVEEAVDRHLFDEIRLFDTNGPKPVLVMESGRGLPTVIHDRALWERFLAKGHER